MGYAYDVFVSYRNLGDTPRWVHEEFLGAFENRLSTELGRPARIVTDRRDIRTGEDWRRRLRELLGGSRVLLAIWEKGYFSSEHCRFEYGATLGREAAAGWGGLAPRRLIWPVQVHDGESIPVTVKKDRHFRDWRSFYKASPGWRTTMDHVRFFDETAELAGEVCQTIELPDFPARPDQLTVVEVEPLELPPALPRYG